ncbi:MAG TPA: DUF6151 family protein [Ramlibacter sp.]
MNHRFQCRCGTVHGEIAQAEGAVRAACYCGDCQAYAHLIGQAPRVLDALGGTEVVATQPRHVRLASGTQGLACLSLSPRGLLRWYASCCSTPIANTPRDWKLPYVGMMHTCLHQPQPLEQSFPTVHMRVNTKSAKGTPPPAAGLAGMARFGGMMLAIAGTRLSGGWRTNPFFDAQGTPIVPVGIAPKESVQAARRASGQA